MAWERRPPTPEPQMVPRPRWWAPRPWQQQRQQWVQTRSVGVQRSNSRQYAQRLQQPRGEEQAVREKPR
eukprot:1853510-Lingulodinium_polyedra.AAC.1